MSKNSMNPQRNVMVASPRKIAEEKFKASRMNLILLIVLTVANLIMLAVGSDTMLLFSATVPYYAVLLGIVFENFIFLVVSICIAAICVIAYLICWFASKNNPVWITVALVLFCIDTLGLIALCVWTGDFSGILDFAIHGYVIYQLVVGVVNGKKLKSLPEGYEAEEEEEPQKEMHQLFAEAVKDDPEMLSVTNSTCIRLVDPDEKARVLVEAEFEGHKIQYRRVKAVNELVIDGKVYVEKKMIIEGEHYFGANLDGHTLTVGMDNTSHSFIAVDGEVIAKKLRII